MPKEMDLIKTNTVLRYVKEVKAMRASSTALEALCARMNKILKDMIALAVESARSEDRNTVMPRDMEPAMEKFLGSRDLGSKEIFEELKKSSPIELGEVSKKIQEHIEKESKS